MERHYGMDWLRIGAFALLILYHVGMVFVPWDWHVKTARPLDWAVVPMLATNAWRLPLLFVVSGFASAALLARGGGLAGFARTRTVRLMIPTLFAVAVVIPPQPWVELVTQHGYRGSFWHFWTSDYFRFGTLDGIVLPTWQHLWFVVYLWVYTLVLAALLAACPRPARAAAAGAVDAALSGYRVLLVPIGVLAAHLALSWPGQAETHALVDDWLAHRIYFAMFLFGVLLRHAPRCWAGIRRWWKVAAVLAIAGYLVVAGLTIAWLGEPAPPAARIAFEGARIVQGWGAIVALIGIADRFWNRDHRWRPTLTEAVFPFYIVHQTVIVLVAYRLLPLDLPPAAEFAILVPATALGCWSFYLAGRRIAWARPLIGLRPR